MIEIDTTTFASRLSELRKEKGITQKNAAKDLSVSQALLSHYEKGIRECSLSFVVKAADYYGVSCDYLLGHENSSVRLEALSSITDIPEDSELSIDTMYRASIIAGQKCISDEKSLEFMMTLYTMATYLLLASGAKRGNIPKNWLIEDNVNDRRLDYLFQSVKLDLLSLSEGHSKKVKNEPRPLSVDTVTKWVNDYLNINIAKLM